MRLRGPRSGHQAPPAHTNFPPAQYGFTFPERSEVTAMIGESIVNNLHSPGGTARPVAYRYRLTPYIHATGTVIARMASRDRGSLTHIRSP